MQSPCPQPPRHPRPPCSRPAPNQPSPAAELPNLEPLRTLLSRSRVELSYAFDFSRQLRASRAADLRDGAIAAAVILQVRTDREIQIFSFDQFDLHRPFTFRAALDALARVDEPMLRQSLADPNSAWASSAIECLHSLHQTGRLDLRRTDIAGLNLAMLSTNEQSAESLAAALRTSLLAHFNLDRDADQPTRVPVTRASCPCEVLSTGKMPVLREDLPADLNTAQRELEDGANQNSNHSSMTILFTPGS